MPVWLGKRPRGSIVLGTHGTGGVLWILITGFWNDASVWNDSAAWKD